MTIIAADKTNRSIYIRIVEDASGTVPGEPKTGLTFSNISSASFARNQAARVAITPITLASPSAAHADGGFVEVDATNMPGVYRFDIPDAAIALGVDSVVIFLVVAGAQNALALPFEIEINVAQTVWDALGADHKVAGSMGEKMAAFAPIHTFVEASPAPTATIFELDDITMTDDTMIDAILVFIDGNLIGQARRIVSNTVNGQNEVRFDVPWQFQGADGAPSSGDRCVVIQGSVARGVADAVWDEVISTRLAGLPGTAAAHLFGITPGADQTDAIASATANVFETGLTEADDFWNGHYLTFVEGNLAGQTRRITDFEDALGKVTVSPGFTAAPGTDSEFVISAMHAPSMVEALLDDALAELAAVPTATPKVREALMWLYMKIRNKSVTDDSGSPTKHQVFDDAGVKIGEASVTDTGGGGAATRDKYS